MVKTTVKTTVKRWQTRKKRPILGLEIKVTTRNVLVSVPKLYCSFFQLTFSMEMYMWDVAK